MMKAAAEGVRRTKSVTLYTVFLRMTFDRAGFNISGRLHACPKKQPVTGVGSSNWSGFHQFISQMALALIIKMTDRTGKRLNRFA